jgi:pimeloyl-ACP methyl ester carboxylesterase
MNKIDTQYIDLGDIRLAYREHGTGPNLLLLHGNSESKAIFQKYQLEFFRDHHTIAVDSRGHGQSVSEDSEYSIKQFADDMLRLCKAKGIQQANVIGYSDGGNIALFLAKMAPDLFPRIVAISPNYLVSGTEEKTLSLFKALAKVVEFLGKCGFKTEKTQMKFKLMLEDIGITDAELMSIRTSLKLLCAQHDMIKEEHIRQIARLVPNSTVTKIGHCNHITILDKPEAIEAVRDYLQS